MCDEPKSGNEERAYLYLCDGMKCKNGEHCYINGGRCCHTPDEEHSIIKQINKNEETGLSINTIFKPFFNTGLYFEVLDDANLLSNLNKILQQMEEYKNLTKNEVRAILGCEPIDTPARFVE